jgi:hypothetical protein
MAITPKSQPASKAADTATQLSTEKTDLDPKENRIADLEQRINEMSERLAFAAVETASSPIDAQIVEQQNVQIRVLQTLIGDLGDRLTAFQAVTARDGQFKDAVRSVEKAAAAVQSGLAPSSIANVSDYTSPHGLKPKRDCECEPCECVSCACCTFEIWMSHVRVDQMQNPLIDVLPPSADSNALPTGMMEVWMFASIDPVNNIGVCIPDPSPTSYLPLHKQITDPTGPMISVNRCVGTVTVKKGLPLDVTVALTAVERETAEERVQPINRDEWGSNTGTVTLDCCYSSYSPIDIPVSLTSWGQAGGAITGRFIVVKRC